MKRHLYFLVLVFFTGCNLFESSSGEKNEKPQEDIRSQISINLNDSSDGSTYVENHFDPDNTGFLVYDLDEKKVLLTHNGEKAFIPASTEKLMTVFNAFDILGDFHHFSTYVYYQGEIKAGVLDGDLYLKGGGDPYLTVSDLIEIIQEIKAKGISKVNGGFYFDQSALAHTDILDRTMDLDESYNCGISALSLDYNTINAHWHTNKGAENPTIVLTPDLPIFATGIEKKEEKKEQTKEKEEKKETTLFFHEYRRNASMWKLSPEAKSRGDHKIPVRRTALYTSSFFRKLASIQGVTLPRPQEQKVPRKARLLLNYRGASISEIADITLTYSVNMMAELLFLSSAKELNPEAIKYSSASKTMEEHIKAHYPKVNWDNFRIYNGSGLSSRNRITPEQMTAFLVWADATKFNDKKITYFLQPSGWEWSLRNRFYEPDDAFHIYAKTGTINYAVALAGYLYTASGKRVAFCFFNDNKYLRSQYEKSPDRMTQKEQKAASRWNYAHRNEMDRIIDRWIREI